MPLPDEPFPDELLEVVELDALVPPVLVELAEVVPPVELAEVVPPVLVELVEVVPPVLVEPVVLPVLVEPVVPPVLVVDGRVVPLTKVLSCWRKTRRVCVRVTGAMSKKMNSSGTV